MESFLALIKLSNVFGRVKLRCFSHSGRQIDFFLKNTNCALQKCNRVSTPIWPCTKNLHNFRSMTLEFWFSFAVCGLKVMETVIIR